MFLGRDGGFVGLVNEVKRWNLLMINFKSALFSGKIAVIFML